MKNLCVPWCKYCYSVSILYIKGELILQSWCRYCKSSVTFHLSVWAGARYVQEIYIYTHTQMISLLTSKSLTWVMPIWKKEVNLCLIINTLFSFFWHVFNHAPERKETEEHLTSAKQGCRRVMECALEFQTLVAKWNRPALKTVFCQGFNVEILTELTCQDDKAHDSLTNLAIHLYVRFPKPWMLTCLESQLFPTWTHATQ